MIQSVNATLYRESTRAFSSVTESGHTRAHRMWLNLISMREREPALRETRTVESEDIHISPTKVICSSVVCVALIVSRKDPFATLTRSVEMVTDARWLLMVIPLSELTVSVVSAPSALFCP